MTGALVVMAKRPAAGRTKTRLIGALTAEGAAALYAGFLCDALENARSVPAVAHCIAYPAADGPSYFTALAPDFALLPQVGETLSERLDYVLRSCFDAGRSPVVAMSSDSPTLPPAYVNAAFEQLHTGSVDVALGPCADGGYYLIGLTHPQPRLFSEVRMSTPHVLQDTLALAHSAGLRACLLPEWYDVDVVDDLRRLQRELAAAPRLAPHTRAALEAV